MFESKINRGRANGYAPLDGSGKVPLDKLPPIQSTINTGSFVTTNQTGSFVTANQTGSFATTSSLQTLVNVTASFATTGSNIFRGNQSISGSVNISSSLIVSSTVVNNGTIDALNSDLIIDGGDIIVTGSLNVSGSQTITGSNGRLIYRGTTIGAYPTLAEIHSNDDYPWLERFYNDTFSTSSAVVAYYGHNDGRFVFHNESTQSIGLQVNGFSGENGLLVYSDKVTFINNAEVSGSLNVSGSIYADNLVGLISSSAQITQFGGLTKNSGSWTVEPGTANYSFTLDSNNTYQIWVLGNIPNGIISYNGMVTLSNTNVPVIGSHNAWYYDAGGALLLTSIPNQIVTTSGSISTVLPGGIGTNTNTFTFGITNTTEENAIVNYGYVKIS